ncbi:hypothetical protein ACFROC_24060 [Nocardia tengchongensis]|uniref:hypothetical protein n=1 Tax=Nocardia tengchongensis TaxID=2055889 RepID=UPI0036B02B1C
MDEPDEHRLIEVHDADGLRYRVPARVLRSFAFRPEEHQQARSEVFAAAEAERLRQDPVAAATGKRWADELARRLLTPRTRAEHTDS